MSKIGKILVKKAIGTTILGAIGAGWFLYKQEREENRRLRDELGAARGDANFYKQYFDKYMEEGSK